MFGDHKIKICWLEVLIITLKRKFSLFQYLYPYKFMIHIYFWLILFLDDYTAESWNNAWDFDDSPEEKIETVKLKREDQSWLQDCISSLSPSADVLALAYCQHAVFFTCKLLQ